MQQDIQLEPLGLWCVTWTFIGCRHYTDCRWGSVKVLKEVVTAVMLFTCRFVIIWVSWWLVIVWSWYFSLLLKKWSTNFYRFSPAHAIQLSILCFLFDVILFRYSTTSVTFVLEYPCADILGVCWEMIIKLYFFYQLCEEVSPNLLNDPLYMNWIGSAIF